MNVYDFDGTIYKGDSSLDFFKFFIKKDPKILAFTPAVLKIIDDYRKTTLRFDDVIAKYGHVITDYVPALYEEFWATHEKNIKPFYKHVQK